MISRWVGIGAACRAYALASLVIVSACGSEPDQDPPCATSSNPAKCACAKIGRISAAKGCARVACAASVEALEQCARALAAWVDCVALDLGQCMCEIDGDLNCEGSFKPNEGPAQCIEEYAAAMACIDANETDEDFGGAAADEP